MTQIASPAGAVCRLVDRARRRRDLPIVLCVDVEPDERAFPPGSLPTWRGFERFLEQLPALRERLSGFTQAPVAFSWFLRMDPQIAETWGAPAWVVETYWDALDELTRAGDEFGLHTHPWRWDAEATEWVADFEDPEWAELCLTMGLDAFETAFGRTCAVHRGGDRFLSGAMLSSLERRGVKIDLTPEPGLPPTQLPANERARGRNPDYRGVPTRPYRSSAGAFPAPDPASRADPLIVPLLSAPWRRLRRMPLSPETRPWRFIARLSLQMLREPPRVAVLSVRSDSRLDAGWEALSSNLEHLARHRRSRFVTASAAVELLRVPPAAPRVGLAADRGG